MKKQLLILAAILILMLLFSACSPRGELPVAGDTSNDTTPGTINDDADTTAINSMDEKITPSYNYSEKEIISIIDTNIDILASKMHPLADDNEIMEAYPTETRAILGLGEAALPHLKDIAGKFIANNEDLESYRAVMAMALAYKIKPELYELRFESPNGKYVLMASVESFAGMFDPFSNGFYCNVRIVAVESEEVVIADKDVCYSNIEVNWSDDSRYTAIREGHQRYGTRIVLFDLQRKEFTALPYMEIADQILPGVSPYSYHLKFKSFDNESERITVSFEMWLNDVAGTGVVGEYTYDIDGKKIVNMDYNKYQLSEA